jgi:hypothetical protein
MAPFASPDYLYSLLKVADIPEDTSRRGAHHLLEPIFELQIFQKMSSPISNADY